MTLVEKANKIIQQQWHTPEDITQLHRIKREMSQEYMEAKQKAGNKESQYKHERMVTYAKSIKEWNTDSKSKEIWRYKAETEYWDYRLYRDFAHGMKAQIDAITQFCIDYYHKMNAEKSASMHDLDNN